MNSMLCRLLSIFCICSIVLALVTIEALGQGKKSKKKASPPKKVEQPKPVAAKPAPRAAKINVLLKEIVEYKSGKAVGPVRKDELIEFNRNGNQTLFAKYDDDRPAEYIMYVYNSKGKKTEEKKFDEDSVLVAWTIHRYDVSGNLVEEMRHSPKDSSVTGKKVFRYDPNGNKEEEIVYDEDGDVENKLALVYDAKGNNIESALYKGNGNLKSKTKFTFDGQGRKVESILYDADGDIESKTIYKFDTSGNLLEESATDSDGKIKARTEYKYDSAGNRIEVNKYKSGNELESREKSRYEGKNKVETSYYDSDDEFTHKIISKFDPQGNVVEETDHDKLGEPQKGIRYTITYF